MTKNKEKSTMKKGQAIHLVALSSVLFLLILANIFFYLGWPGENTAQAISSNYSKTAGQQLGLDNWNNLPADFVAKSGDTMSGPLNMGGGTINNLGNAVVGTDAVNQTTMTNAIASAMATAGQIKDISGPNLKMFCGKSATGSWVAYPGGAYIDVNLSAANFTAGSVPYIFTSLGGSGLQWRTRGQNSIYPPDDITQTLLYQGFRVYVYNDTGVAFPYNSYAWYINWCALGV